MKKQLIESDEEILNYCKTIINSDYVPDTTIKYIKSILKQYKNSIEHNWKPLKHKEFIKLAQEDIYVSGLFGSKLEMTEEKISNANNYYICETCNIFGLKTIVSMYIDGSEFIEPLSDEHISCNNRAMKNILE